jgi:hypothetical protein
MYSIVQEMGCVNQNPLDESGNNKYEVHVLFQCLVKLYMRIMQQPDQAEQGIQLKAMMEMVQLLVIPRKCQHIIIECYFKDPALMREYSPCQTKCMYCISGVKSLTGCINCSRTCNLLISFCTGRTQSTSDLIKFVTVEKHDIFHAEDVPMRFMGPIHMFCLQLVATGIIELSICNEKKNLIGKSEFHHSNIIIKLEIVNGQAAVLINSYWEGDSNVNLIY